MTDQSQVEFLLAALQRMHSWIREKVADALVPMSIDEASVAVDSGAGDFVYAIDRVSENELVEFVSREIASKMPVVLVGEGLPDGKIVLPRGIAEESALWRIIVDPIDGTRGLMFQKRSGWILTGAAPNCGDATSLGDIELAIQTEIPLVTQFLSDQAWAIRGQGATGVRWNRQTGATEALPLTPSTATTLHHGYATVCRFFPGGRDVLAALDEKLMTEVLGPRATGEALVFEDQFACTGGQLFGLISGKDRFVADLRPLLADILSQRGEPLGHCCHPYDLCTMLIAREAGAVIDDPAGNLSATPLDTEANVAWVGYANQDLRRVIHPALQRLLAEFDMAVPAGREV